MSTASQNRLGKAGARDAAAPSLPVGVSIDRGFGLLGRAPQALVLPPLLLNLIPLAVALVLSGVAALALGSIATTTKTVRESTFFGDSTLHVREVADFTAGQTAILVAFGVLAGIVYVAGMIAAYAAVVRAAERALQGSPPLSTRAAMGEALRVTPALFGLTVAFALVALVAVAVAGLLVALAAQVSIGLAILLGVLGALAAILLGVRLMLWPIVALTEGPGLGVLPRTWRLTRGQFWALLAVLLLVTIVVAVAYAVLGVALSLILGGLLNLDEVVGVAALLPYVLLSALFGVILTALAVAPLVVAHDVLAGTVAPAA